MTPHRDRATVSVAGDTYLSTLDGMRGVAAIAVFFSHAAPMTAPFRVPSASLAVDFFFMLSGYVIIHAYADRLRAGMSLSAFLAQRLRRLYPLYAIGVAIGCLDFLLRWQDGEIAGSGGAVAVAVASSWLMLPSPIAFGYHESFPINGPRWSLFFELVVNAGLVRCWSRIGWTRAMAATGAVLSMLLAVVVLKHGSIEIGWSDGSLPFGVLRAGAPFAIGAALRLAGPPAPVPSVVATLLVLALVPLFLIDPATPAVYAMLLVTAVFPPLVWLGSQVRSRRPALFVTLGAISYPFYVLHVPLLSLATWIAHRLGIDPAASAPWSGLGALAVLMLISWVAAKTYDPWARRRLRLALRLRSGPFDARRPDGQTAT